VCSCWCYLNDCYCHYWRVLTGCCSYLMLSKGCQIIRNQKWDVSPTITNHVTNNYRCGQKTSALASILKLFPVLSQLNVIFSQMHDEIVLCLHEKDLSIRTVSMSSSHTLLSPAEAGGEDHHLFLCHYKEKWREC
jgi:hypothetical protein